MIKKTALPAFTLIELLVVISIIGILIALSLFVLEGVRKTSRDSQRKSDLELIRGGIEAYKVDCNKYPVGTYTTNWPLQISGDGSTAACPTTNNYIISVPRDPLASSRYYRYFSDGKRYEICASLENGTGAVSCGGSSLCSSQIGEAPGVALAAGSTISFVLNQSSGKSCSQVCQEAGGSCNSVGTDVTAQNYIARKVSGICQNTSSGCATVMNALNYPDPASPSKLCDWTYCSCGASTDCYLKPDGTTCYILDSYGCNPFQPGGCPAHAGTCSGNVCKEIATPAPGQSACNYKITNP